MRRITTKSALAALEESSDPNEIKNAAEFLVMECGESYAEQDEHRMEGLVRDGVLKAIVRANF